jgi:hypothetical protein
MNKKTHIENSKGNEKREHVEQSPDSLVLPHTRGLGSCEQCFKRQIWQRGGSDPRTERQIQVAHQELNTMNKRSVPQRTCH